MKGENMYELLIIDTAKHLIFSSMHLIESDKNTRIYSLYGFDDNAMHYLRVFLLEKMYFDCEISREKKVVIKGDKCWFNNVDFAANKSELIINFIQIEVSV